MKQRKALRPYSVRICTKETAASGTTLVHRVGGENDMDLSSTTVVAATGALGTRNATGRSVTALGSYRSGL
ncbi:hypothetical protein EVAR_30100_1 [Eumeta japonica]|uniref:Uncharacterized protein n=1 Tax=Eumeta variegata TaxID=151549 RepID=A0A4C1WH41_EUMVA|nr:hypothetical protein EVAR_30100_1 [Eumeta japonica]